MTNIYAPATGFYHFDSQNSEPDNEYEIDELATENKNTKRKTETDMRIFSAYLISLKESRKAEEIPPQELDPYLSMFFSVVKKHDGHEYEPASLRGMLCSVERYLRMKGYRSSITRDAAFTNTRNTLKNKQRVLRENGKGMKKLVTGAGPDPLCPSTTEKVNHLYAAKELGPYNPMSVINSLCFAFVVYFKMRKAIDHKQLLWGDIVLRSSASSEFLCYEPVEGKEYIRSRLKGIEDYKVRSNSMSGPNKDAILIYKLYSQKRPAQMMSPDSPFYLGVSTSNPVQNQPWYKSLPMGVNKLNDLVRMIRDITGIQKPQSLSNPNSPDGTNRPLSPLPRRANSEEIRNVELDATGQDPDKIDSDENKAPFEGRFNQCVSGGCRNSVCGSTDGATEVAVDLSNTASRVEASIEATKATIRGLLETLDKSSRVNLVNWMNRIELDSDGDRLKENLKCLSRCQIIVDINTRDLTQHQVLDLTGSMKIIPLENKSEEIDASEDSQCIPDMKRSGDNYETNGTISESQPLDGTYHTEGNGVDSIRMNRECHAVGESLRDWPLSTKRELLEGHWTSESGNTKKLKLNRSCSNQECVQYKRYPNDCLLKTNATKTEETEDNNTKETISVSGQTDSVKNDELINLIPGLKPPPTEIRPTLYSPHWIPPHVFQPLSYHPLPTYADPRWLKIYGGKPPITSMESVFRQPLDTHLLRRVYANLDAAHFPKSNLADTSNAEAVLAIPLDNDMYPHTIDEYSQSVALDVHKQNNKVEDHQQNVTLGGQNQSAILDVHSHSDTVDDHKHSVTIRDHKQTSVPQDNYNHSSIVSIQHNEETASASPKCKYTQCNTPCVEHSQSNALSAEHTQSTAENTQLEPFHDETLQDDPQQIKPNQFLTSHVLQTTAFSKSSVMNSEILSEDDSDSMESTKTEMYSSDVSV